MNPLTTRENAHHILGMLDALMFGLIPLDSTYYCDWHKPKCQHETNKIEF